MVALFNLSQERAAELRRWQAVFEHDGNKAAAWRCYHLARAWSLPIPESVLSELDRIAMAIGSEVERSRKPNGKPKDASNDDAGLSSDRVGRIVTQAYRGSADPAAALIAWERDFEVASAVGGLRAGGMSEVAAVTRVAAGTKDLAYGVRIEEDTAGFGPVPTPALSIDLVRRAVRRVKALTTNMTETPVLMSMTGGDPTVSI